MRYFFLFLAILFLAACGQDSSKKQRQAPVASKQKGSQGVANPFNDPYSTRESSERGNIYLVADESLRPIVEVEAANFMAIYKRARLNIRYLPGERAIEALVNNDSFRMAITTRPLRPEEEEFLIERSIVPRTNHIATDGIALVVHPDNPLAKLDTEVLKGILAGSIDQWPQVSDQAPGGKIVVVFDNPYSSTAQYLRDSFLVDRPMTKQVYAAQSSPQVVEYVANNPRALGLMGSAWLSDLRDPEVQQRLEMIKVLKLENAQETGPCLAYDQDYFAPYQSFLFLRCYPLARSAYTILRETRVGLGTGFVSYIDSDPGQRIIHSAGLVARHTIPREVIFPGKEKALIDSVPLSK